MVLLQGLGVHAAEWRLIRSAGRQGVARSFREGGLRKARIKLYKMVAAAERKRTSSSTPSSITSMPAGAQGGWQAEAVPTSQQIDDESAASPELCSSGPTGPTVVAGVDKQPQEHMTKKRRRRANAKARRVANARGCLTQDQLFSLFASQQQNWQRIRAWLDAKAGARDPGRKRRRRAGWRAEYGRFRQQFRDYPVPQQHVAEGGAAGALPADAQASTTPPKGEGQAQVEEAQARTLAVFTSVVSMAMLGPPDANAAKALWRVLAAKNLAGAAVGPVAMVPLGEENVGMRMLQAMGWVQGTGLGAVGREGIVEPVAATPQRFQQCGLGFAGSRRSGRRKKPRSEGPADCS